MNICLSEIKRCQQTSPRPNFIVLLGNRYGWMPPPAQIPQDEFEQILSVVSEGEKSQLINWYTLDKNARIPGKNGIDQHEYRLKPRKKGFYKEYKDWQPVETNLHNILAKAVDNLNFPEDRKLTYQASATHQEIQAGALGQKDAPEHVFCFFRDIPDFPKTFSKPGYDEMLSARVKLEYPLGLKVSCENLVQGVLDLPAHTPAKGLHEHLKHEQSRVFEQTDEESVLKFSIRCWWILSGGTSSTWMKRPGLWIKKHPRLYKN